MKILILIMLLFCFSSCSKSFNIPKLDLENDTNNNHEIIIPRDKDDESNLWSVGDLHDTKTAWKPFNIPVSDEHDEVPVFDITDIDDSLVWKANIEDDIVVNMIPTGINYSVDETWLDISRNSQKDLISNGVELHQDLLETANFTPPIDELPIDLNEEVYYTRVEDLVLDYPIFWNIHTESMIISYAVNENMYSLRFYLWDKGEYIPVILYEYTFIVPIDKNTYELVYSDFENHEVFYIGDVLPFHLISEIYKIISHENIN